MSGRPPSLLRSALSNWVALAANVLSAFYLTPVILTSLGREGYGTWSIIVSLIGYYGLLDIGISSAVTRYTAKYAASGELRSLEKVAGTSLFLLTGLGAALIGLSFAASGPLAGFFGLEGARRAEFVSLVGTVGIAAGLSFPVKAYRSVLLAYERFVPHNVLRIVLTAARTVLTVAVLRRNAGIVGIGYVYLTVQAVELTAYGLMVSRVLPGLRFRISDFDRKTVRLLAGFGAAAFLVTVADQMRFNLDGFVIGRMIGLEAVAVYRIAAMIMRNLLSVLVAALAVLTPRFARLEGQGSRDALERLFLKSLAVSSVMSFGAAAMVFSAGGTFIRLWVGDGFEGAVPVLLILASAYAVSMAQNPVISLVYALNRHRFYAALTAAEAVCNVALSVALAPRFGILGVAIGAAVPMLAARLVIQPYYMIRVVGIRARSYLARIALPAAAAAIVIAAVWRTGLVTGRREVTLPAALGISAAAAAVLGTAALFWLARLGVVRLPRAAAMSGRVGGTFRHAPDSPPARSGTRAGRSEERTPGETADRSTGDQ